MSSSSVVAGVSPGLGILSKPGFNVPIDIAKFTPNRIASTDLAKQREILVGLCRNNPVIWAPLFSGRYHDAQRGYVQKLPNT
jgi:hypothetical protein